VRVLPLFGKTAAAAAAAAARSRARKIDGGCFTARVARWRLNERGLPNEYRNIARVNLEAAKQKVARDNDLSNVEENNLVDAREDRIDNKKNCEEITIRKVTEGTVSHFDTNIKIYF